MKYIYSHRLSAGFTLIELMVAISIIAILTSIIYVNFGDARAIARDDVRKSDLSQIQLAVELYRSENGQFPATLDDLVTGGFLPSVPTDPRGGSYVYLVATSNDAYKIIATGVESKVITGASDQFANPPDYAPNEYAVYSPGGRELTP